MKKRTKRHTLLIGLLVLAISCGLAAMGINGYHRYCCAAYPLAYTDTIRQYGDEYGISPSLIAAIICVESHFQPESVSHAGAIGLMQLTPETFTWAQVRSGIRDTADATALNDPDTNIRFGVFTLKLLYEQFDNQTAVLAAYNAGQGNVRRWLQNPQYSADGSHLDNIPYPETAAYVERVRTAQKMYRKLYDLA